MHSFSNIFVTAAVILALTTGSNQISCYMYESARDNIVLIKEDLKETEGTVETLLLGTSLMDQGGDSPAIGDMLDTVCFNLASSAQPLCGSYFLLKDEINRNPIERVFLGMSVKSLVSDSDSKNTSSKLRVYDQIFSPVIKAEFLMEIAEPEEFEQFLFYTARVDNVLSVSAIKANIEYKRSEDFKNRVSHEKAKYTYYGMGFQSSEAEYDPATQKKKKDNTIFWDREKIVASNVEYLMQVIELCREEEIELNLVVFPHTCDTSLIQGDLADMDVYMAELCSRENVALFNYNYTAYEGIYDILTDDCFQDAKHLNRKGASKFAELLCEDYQNS